MIKSKILKYRTSLRIVWWITLILTYIAAVLPQNLAPTVGSLNDKSHHILAFLVLGLLLRFAYEIKYWHAFLALVVFGAFIEVSQLFAINRSAEVVDVLADVIGIFIGLKLYKYLQKVI